MLFRSYEAVRDIARQDDVVFRSPERMTEVEDGTLMDLLGGNRVVNYLVGEEHKALHQWFLRAFSPRRMEDWRRNVIQPIMNQAIDRFASRGKAELVAEFAQRVPIRVVAAVMGLPWQDDAWADRCFQTMKPIERFFNYSTLGGDDVMQAARRAAHEMNRVLMPFVDRKSTRLNSSH